MLQNGKNDFRRRIIDILIKQRSASALEMQAELRANKTPCTIQNIYYILRLLQADGVIVKAKKKFSLSIAWALQIVKFADHLEQQFIGSAYSSELLPKSDRKISWEFPNLLKLDDFWVQAMIAAFQETGSSNMYSACHHPWFYFAQARKMHIFYKLLEEQKKQIKLCISGDTYLDRVFENSVSKKLYHVVVGEDLMKLTATEQVVVIGDYIFTVRINKITAREISELFNGITKAGEINYMQIFHTLNRSTIARLVIENSANQAKKIAGRFSRYFG